MRKRDTRRTVTWVDSTGTPGWCDPGEEVAVPVTCETTGYVIKRGREGIVLALSRVLDDDRVRRRFADTICIPTAAVKRIRRVK